MLGLILVGVGLWGALRFVPAHDASGFPIDSEKLSDLAYAFGNENAWYIRNDLVVPAYIAAWVVVGLGVLQLLTGSATRVSDRD